ncbi:MAG: MATE family efflux transporter [Sneathiella sp.]
MEKSSIAPENMYLSTPLGILFFKTAIPIIMIMMTNGLFTVIDGWFVGHFVGPDALSAVTMVFPLFMMLIALGTLVSTGFASVLARMLGAGQRKEGEEALTSALILSAVICGILFLLFALYGRDLVLAIANGSPSLAGMGHVYMSLTIQFSPLFFLLSLLSDSFRCQGKLGAMTLFTVGATLLNMFFNYLLIVEFNMGVAGSAYGTALAQVGASIAAFGYMYSNDNCLRFRLNNFAGLFRHWGSYLALGAPSSLSYVGVSVISASIVYQLQVWNSTTYEVSVAAYGITTRLMTFGYMPLLGMTLAQQAIVGNNFGAGNWERTIGSLKITLLAALVYCAILQLVFIFLPGELSRLFVDSPEITQETIRILPPMAWLYVLFGPLLMLPSFFQAIGDAKRAALLGLTKIYLFSIPLILILPHLIGEMGIWYAGPLTEVIALILTGFILWQAGLIGKKKDVLPRSGAQDPVG